MEYYGVDYCVGPSPPGPLSRLINDANILNAKIHNVVGTIPGRSNDELVILGNHRDAWGLVPEIPAVVPLRSTRSFAALVSLPFSRAGVRRGPSFSPVSKAKSLPRSALCSGSPSMSTGYVAPPSHISTSLLRHRGPISMPKPARSCIRRFSPPPTLCCRPIKLCRANRCARSLDRRHHRSAGSGDANRFMSIPCVSTVDFGFSPALGEPAFPTIPALSSFEWMDQVGDPGGSITSPAPRSGLSWRRTS